MVQNYLVSFDSICGLGGFCVVYTLIYLDHSVPLGLFSHLASTYIVWPLPQLFQRHVFGIEADLQLSWLLQQLVVGPGLLGVFMGPCRPQTSLLAPGPLRID